jgi:hypothetical protein
LDSPQDASNHAFVALPLSHYRFRITAVALPLSRNRRSALNLFETPPSQGGLYYSIPHTNDVNIRTPLDQVMRWILSLFILPLIPIFLIGVPCAQAQYALGFEGSVSPRTGVPSWYASFGDRWWTAQVHAPGTIVQDPIRGTSASLSVIGVGLGGLIVGADYATSRNDPNPRRIPISAYVLSPLFLSNAQFHGNVIRNATNENVTFLASTFIGHRTDLMIDYNTTSAEEDLDAYWLLYTPMVGIRILRGDSNNRGRNYRRGLSLAAGMQYPYRYRDGTSEWTGAEPFVSLRVVMLTP